jgi:hypothetical protein
MSLFGRPRIDDPELARLLGGRRVLASGRSPHGAVVGLADALVHTDGEAWHEVPWHLIEHGGWDQSSRTLRWTRTDGADGSVELVQTGQLPDLFNERVTATIACVRAVELAGGGRAVITARRSLADPSAPLDWRLSPGKGVRREDLDADPLVALQVERLRAEYDVG